MRKCYCLHRQVIFLLAAQLSTYAVFVAGFLIITQEPTKRNVFNEINNPQFDRLIVIVVDAMRFDMANPFPDLPLETTPEFVNRVPFIRQLLEQRPHQSAMYKFVADDPTVTTSRLKCMMTGTSPSFLEVGTSFIGITITEDNLLEQYTYRNKSSFVPGQQCDARDKRLWAMGDDTWTQLLSIKDQPSQCSVWNFTDVLPSFTITDVHENDKTILQTLVPQLLKLKKDKSQIDWDLLIGHFLGIDHLMHVKTLKNYQHNPELTVKIDQIDSVLRVVVDFIDREQQEIIQQQIIKQENGQNGSENGDKIRKGTLLVVFGDHGMTEEGTHQGRNLEETDAALFFYSPRPVMAFTQSIIAPNELSQQLNETVAQDNLIDQNNFLYLSRPVCQQEQENDEKRWMKTLKKNELLKNHLIETKYIAQSTHCRPVTAPVQTQYQNGSLDKKSNILVPSNCTSCYPTIRQIDITPTLSALYGIPIPFPSSGKGMAEWTTLLDQEDIVVATQWKQKYIKQQQKNERSNKVNEGYGKDNNELSELSSARSLSSYIGDKSSITEFSRIDQNHYQSKNQFYDERIILNISDDPSLQHDFDLLEYFYREERHPVPPRNRQQIKKIAEKRLPEILIDLEDLKNEQLRNGIFGAIEQSRIERVRQRLKELNEPINSNDLQHTINNNNNQHKQLQYPNLVTQIFKQTMKLNLNIMKQLKMYLQDHITNNPLTRRSLGLQQYNTMEELNQHIKEVEQIIKQENIKEGKLNGKENIEIESSENTESKIQDKELKQKIDRSDILQRQQKFLNKTQNILFETTADMARKKMKLGWVISIIVCLATEIAIIFWNFNIHTQMNEEQNNSEQIKKKKESNEIKKDDLISKIIDNGKVVVVLIISFYILTRFEEQIGLLGIITYIILLIVGAIFNFISPHSLSLLGSIIIISCLLKGKQKSQFAGSLLIFSSLILQIAINIINSRKGKKEKKKKENIPNQQQEQYLSTSYPLIFLFIFIFIHIANTTTYFIEYEQNMHIFFLIIIILYYLYDIIGNFATANKELKGSNEQNEIKQDKKRHYLSVEIKACIAMIIIIGISFQLSAYHSIPVPVPSFIQKSVQKMKIFFESGNNNHQTEQSNQNSLPLMQMTEVSLYMLYVIVDFYLTYKFIGKIKNNIQAFLNRRQQSGDPQEQNPNQEQNQFQIKLHSNFAQIALLTLIAIQKIVLRSNLSSVLQQLQHHSKFISIILNVIEHYKSKYTYLIPRVTIFGIIPITVLIDIAYQTYSSRNKNKNKDNNKQTIKKLKTPPHIIWMRTATFLIIPNKLFALVELGNVGYLLFLLTLHCIVNVFISHLKRQEIEDEKQTNQEKKKKTEKSEKNIDNSNASSKSLLQNLLAIFSIDKYLSKQRNANKKQHSDSLKLSHDLLPGLFMWLISSFFFFTTGSHNHFGAINISTAYAFTDEFDVNTHLFLSAFGVVACCYNIFGSYMICIPFITVLGRLSINKRDSKQDQKREQGQLHQLILNHPYTLTYVLFQGVDLMSLISFVFFRTDHPLIWTCFAAKYIFVGFKLTIGSLIIFISN